MKLKIKKDDMVVRVINMIIRLASPEYRRFISGAINYGMDSAARDVREKRSAPPDWRIYEKKS